MTAERREVFFSPVTVSFGLWKRRKIMLDTKILVIDDDSNICDLLKIYFENEEYSVKTASDGVEGLNYFKLYEPDLVLLDIMLPKKDGWQVCREIREISSKPIIMITAKGEVFDKVLGLELGADDFVVKPFDMKELSARVKSVLRRYQVHTDQIDDEVIKFENLEISHQKYELKLKGRSVDVPPKELELLYFLAANYNRVFTRDQLLDKVWGFDYLGDSRTVDVHVKRLREKLEGVSEKWVLKTVWGVGYKFELLQ
jgi:DNA-binding response OmpR family regulator